MKQSNLRIVDATMRQQAGAHARPLSVLQRAPQAVPAEAATQERFNVELRTAEIGVWPGRVETIFREDGSVAEADAHWGDPDHIRASWYAGYGGDQRRMLTEHEIAHSFIADELGWPHSWSLWSAAHGTGTKQPMGEWSPRVREEEHLVVSLQRYVNTGLEDEHGKLREAFGERLPEVARRFVALARPWLRIGL